MTLFGKATQVVSKGDLTHAEGNHMMKLGAEYIAGDLAFSTIQSSAIMESPQYTDFRTYGGATLRRARRSSGCTYRTSSRPTV